MATLQDILALKGRDVLSVRPADTVLRAANLMNERAIGGVVVMENARLEGIFTERDILRRVVAQGLDPAATPVSQVMSSPAITCEPTLTIEDAAALMTARRIRHLPVQTGAGLVGLVTIGDILAHQVRDQQDTIAQMNSFIYDNR